MPLLVFEESHKEHLSFLTDLSPEVVQEFGKICLNFINKGTNTKMFQSAAQKLGVSAESVQHGVEGLMFLLTESSKLVLNDIDFQDSLLTLGFSEETRDILFELYKMHRKDIRGIMGEMGFESRQYHNLQWRLDVELASRSLRHQINPKVLLKLDVTEGEEEESIMLETDPVNLVHMAKVLEEALNEIKSGYCRRIVRNIK